MGEPGGKRPRAAPDGEGAREGTRPEQLGHGLEAHGPCQSQHRVAPIPGAVGADLGQRGAEDRLAPAERSGGDRLVPQPRIGAMAERLEILAEVALLPVEPGREGAHPVAAGIGVERGHLDAEDPRGLAGVHERLTWIVESRWIHMKPTLGQVQPEVHA